MTKVNFGKYQGWDTDNLARFTDGRSYLAWGTENLKSPQLRKEFQMTLDSISAIEISIELEAESIMRSDGSCDYLDAEALAREIKADMIENEQRDAAFEAARQHFLNALARAGIDSNGAQRLFNLIQQGFEIEELTDAEKNGRVKFTSSQKRNAVWQAAIELDGDLDNI